MSIGNGRHDQQHDQQGRDRLQHAHEQVAQQTERRGDARGRCAQHRTERDTDQNLRHQAQGHQAHGAILT